MPRRHPLAAAILAIALAGSSGSDAGASSGKAAVATEVPPHDTLVLDPQSGAVRFLRGPDLGAALARPAEGGAASVARAFLDHYAALFRLHDPARELALERVETEPDGAARVRFEQWRDGVPVPDTEVVVHLDGQGRVVAVNGRYVPAPESVGRDTPPGP